MNEDTEIKYKRATEKVKKMKNFYWFLISGVIASAFMIGFAYFLYYTKAEYSFVPITICLASPVVMSIVLLVEYAKVFKSIPFFGKEWEESKIKEFISEDKNLNLWN